jgi:phospholipid N-methyltransferase
MRENIFSSGRVIPTSHWACLANNIIEQSSGLLVLELVKSDDVI